MKISIGKYLKQNRQKLDSDIPDDELIWNGISRGLNKKNQFLNDWFWKVAAIFLLGILTTYVVVNENKKDQIVIVTLSDFSKGLGEQEAGLKQLVDLKWEEVQSKLPAQTSELQFLLDEYNKLDEIYSTYKNDLGKTTENERIIRAMLDQYEKKIKILNRLLLEIEKQNDYENEITL